MHLKNVAHCDLNMENVMFRRDQIFIIGLFLVSYFLKQRQTNYFLI